MQADGGEEDRGINNDIGRNVVPFIHTNPVPKVKRIANIEVKSHEGEISKWGKVNERSGMEGSSP